MSKFRKLIAGAVAALQLIAVPGFAQTFHVQNLSVSGTATFSVNSIAVNSLATVAANSVLANASASTSGVVAVTMPGCTGSQALTWTSGSGFSCVSVLSTASPTFSGTVTINNSSNTNALLVNGSANAQGALIQLQGNGGTTPSKFIQVQSGVFAISNSANNNQLFTLGDTGNAAFDGTLTAGSFPSPALTGTPTAPTAAVATNSTQIATTGFGYLLFASPPTIGGTTPGAALFTTVGASGLISPTSTVGIAGTTTNDNVQAGSIGQYSSGSNTGASVSSGTPLNCTSISLGAGDWEVRGQVAYIPSGGTAIASMAQGFSSSSATLPSLGAYNQVQGSLTSAQQVCTAPIQRFSIASTTTVYLVGQTSYTGGTMTCNGYINARRMR